MTETSNPIRKLLAFRQKSGRYEKQHDFETSHIDIFLPLKLHKSDEQEPLLSKKVSKRERAEARTFTFVFYGSLELWNCDFPHPDILSQPRPLAGERISKKSSIHKI